MNLVMDMDRLEALAHERACEVRIWAHAEGLEKATMVIAVEEGVVLVRRFVMPFVTVRWSDCEVEIVGVRQRVRVLNSPPWIQPGWVDGA